MTSQKTHITIHDIAKKLGVSASTVSRALKDNPRISKATRKTIQDLALEYNYRPNSMAASLRNGKGNTVGVIVPNINRSFFSNIIGGIEEVLSDSGFNLMICQSNENIQMEKSALSTLLDARVDAILMSISMETEDYSHIEDLLKRGMKMLFFDRVPAGLPVHSVVIDDFSAAYRITEHLIQQGYKRPAHIGGSDKINVYANRRGGFLKATKEQGLQIGAEYILEEDMTLEGGKRAFKRLMSLPYPPDALMCSGDFTALGAILSARELGISIPGQLAVSGFANEDFTQFISPPLTTVDQKGMEIGRTLAKIFLSTKEMTSEIQTIIDPELLYRKSTESNLETLKNRRYGS